MTKAPPSGVVLPIILPPFCGGKGVNAVITKKVDVDDRGRVSSKFYGLSTDDKANAEDPRNADAFYEMDTKKVYLYDQENAKWLEQ